MTERILYLIRHGESDFESRDFLSINRGDQWDPPLGVKGREQAGLLVRRLLSMPAPTAVYCSPLRRARETVAPFAAATEIEVRYEDDLMEAYMGDWEGKPFEEILAADEAVLTRVRNQEPIWRHAPGSERLEDFRLRVREAVERIVARHPDGNLFLFCHGGVINAYLAQILGVDHEMFFVPENTSLNSVEVIDEQRRVRFINDYLHLERPNLFED